MAIIKFPPHELANEHGLLAIGGDLEPTSLLLGYRQGIFVWPIDDQYLTWFTPPNRAVMIVDEYEPSRSLVKALRKNPFEIKINSAFADVIKGCATKRKSGGTWIRPDIIEAFCKLNELGHAHSIEAWQDGKLCGGLYGVSVGAVFFAESMFYRKENASKACFDFLCRHLAKLGIPWFDCQVINPFLTQLGVSEISREVFLKLLAPAIKQNIKIF